MIAKTLPLVQLSPANPPSHSEGPADCSEHSAAKRDWQTQLRQAIRDPHQLCQRLGLDAKALGVEQGHRLFSTLVPEALLSRIRPGQPGDPILRQILPVAEENHEVLGFVDDPLLEQTTNPIPGLVHKYRSRVLLIGAGGCAVNCRYCFRRHFPYAENRLSREHITQVMAYLNERLEVNEVILSGGDPLATPDQRLLFLIDQLAGAPYIKRLRIHSRLPVVIPDRVTEALCEGLASTPLQTVMVLHINHPQEIDDTVIEACQRLRQAGVTLLNQTVLLKGVNDQAEVLAELSEQLFAAGIMPYYLHAFDPVAGAAHFAVPDARMQQLYGELLAILPGFLVPRPVREVPDRPGKTPMAPPEAWSLS